MKKTAMIVFTAVLATMLLVSCGNTAGSSTVDNNKGGQFKETEETPTVSKTLDLRNKLSSGLISLSRAADTGVIESADTPEKVNFNYFNNSGTVGKFSKSPFKLEKDPNGIKVTYTKPSEFGEKAPVIKYLCCWYTDGNENASTREILNWDFCNNYSSSSVNSYSKESFDFIFPAIVADKTAKFILRVEYEGGSKYEANYRCTAGGGIGVIDDLPANYEGNGASFSAQHINIEGTKISIIDTIPPEEKIESKLCVFFSLDNEPASLTADNYYSWNTANSSAWVMEIEEPYTASAETSKLYELDFKDLIGASGSYVAPSRNKDYYFVQFNYVYVIDGYDYAKFRTPNIASKIYKNEVLKKNEVSKD